MDLVKCLTEILNGNISDEHKNTFKTWIDESEENVLVFERMSRLKEEGKDIGLLNHLNTAAAWERVVSKMNNSIERQNKKKDIDIYNLNSQKTWACSIKNGC